MNTDEIILMILDAASDGVPGKTAMQKLCYFSSVKLNQDMGFFAHYYGPYSKNVAQHLQLLDSFDLINKESYYTGNNRVFNKFSINSDGKNYVKKIKKQNERAYEVIKEIVKLSELEHMDYNILSYAAKIHYISKNEERKLTDEELIELAGYYDWKLSQEQIDSAKDLLQRLNLAQFSES